MNYVSNKKVFIDYKIYKGLFNKVYINYKKRDYNTKYNFSNIFKKIIKEREKVFKKLVFRLIKTL